jgi:hypothetical protein
MAKAKWAVRVPNSETRSIAFKFADGTEQTIYLRDIPEALSVALILHGLEAKIGDSYAGAAEAVESGKAITELAYAKAQVARVIGNLKAGIWASREAAGPGRLVVAVAEALGITEEKAAERINGWRDEGTEESKKKLAAVRNHPKVKLVMTRLEKEAQERKMRALNGAAEESDKSEVSELFE